MYPYFKYSCLYDRILYKETITSIFAYRLWRRIRKSQHHVKNILKDISLLIIHFQKRYYPLLWEIPIALHETRLKQETNAHNGRYRPSLLVQSPAGEDSEKDRALDYDSVVRTGQGVDQKQRVRTKQCIRGKRRILRDQGVLRPQRERND
ncbi:hypothetical protein C922_03842 [Plasmodium inui San Antonio 1]|uniref:Uncharacterized protein n=1 Tax=Plasmodium inui San Antonio 1 TaxID=1237626 RepID=W7A9P0_9APIC|nr:hypothetical protein C922_03842 [Plasmodium inui San Antonio 1]EUD65859.1 hypothetical protein C922_03842 [Plasmodium inui San Antonio 1]